MQKYLKFVFLFNIIFITQLFSTVFIPIPIERQIETSDLIVMGKVIKKESFKKEGQTFTRYNFVTDYFIGPFEDQFRIEDMISIIVPGGEVNGIVTYVHGAPEFGDEEMVLLLKNIDGDFYLNNLALGKFNFKKTGNERFLSNTVFPFHSQLGKIDYLTFVSKAERILNKNLSIVSHKHHKLLDPSLNRHRSIASLKSGSAKQSKIKNNLFNKDNDSSFLWPMISMLLLLVFSLLARKVYEKN